MNRGGKLDLLIRRGATFRFAFQLLATPPVETVTDNGVVVTPGEPTDITGLNFRAAFRGGDESGLLAFRSRPRDFEVVVMEQDGVTSSWVMFTIQAQATADMAVERGTYDIEAYDETGEVFEVMYGTFETCRETSTGDSNPDYGGPV